MAVLHIVGVQYFAFFVYFFELALVVEIDPDYTLRSVVSLYYSLPPVDAGQYWSLSVPWSPRNHPGSRRNVSSLDLVSYLS